MATMAFFRLGPRMATMAMAKSRLGRASIMSMTRITMVSKYPPIYPDVMPMRIPAARERVTTITPTNKLSRAP